MEATLETVLANILRREKNSIEIIEQLAGLYSSTNEKVKIEIVQEDNTITEFEIPSYGFLLQEIKKINNNFEQITGLNASSASIIFSDGTRRNLFLSKARFEPSPISDVSTPDLFYKKINRNSEKLLNPLPTVKFDMTGKIDLETTKILVRKIIPSLLTDSDQNFFDLNIKSVVKTNDEIIKIYESTKIDFEIFEEQIEINPKLVQYSGKFDVLGVNKVGNDIKYELRSLNYLNNENQTSVQLQVGDTLVSLVDTFTTYLVKSVDVNTNEIVITTKTGYTPLNVGVEVLTIYSETVKENFLEIPVSVNERLSIFLKQINSNSISSNWGDSISFNTNDLVDSELDTTTLPEYYEQIINDINRFSKALKEDNKIPITEAIKPDAPVLNVTDFKVLKINTHQDANQTVEELKRKFSEKNKLKSEIDRLSTSVVKAKKDLSDGNFKTEAEKNSIKKKIDSFIKERTSKIEEYNSLISELISSRQDIEKIQPKYRVRGFWAIPEPKYKDEKNKIGKQEVVKFLVQYRYLTIDEDIKESDGFKFKDAIGKLFDATFSKWNLQESVIRQREVLTLNKVVGGKIVKTEFTDWKFDDTNDPDLINPNQLDIPINSNESVEIRIKSISEAGFPFVESDWTTPITIRFPEELKEDLSFIFSQAESESVKANLLKELSGLGLDSHLIDSQLIGNKYYAHSGDSVFSNIKNDNGEILSVNEAVSLLQNQIESLMSNLSGDSGKLRVRIVDEFGKLVKEINNNDTVNIFAGYYKDLVSQSPIRKGQIITKLYYIEISNTSSADLEVVSYVPGLETDILPKTNLQNVLDYIGYINDKTQYSLYRRYWNAPISLRSIIENSEFRLDHTAGKSPFVELPSLQSSQVKGQLLYVRERDISLSELLFDSPTDLNQATLLPDFTGLGSYDYLWNGTFTLVNNKRVPNFGGGLSEFAIHKDHPQLKEDSELLVNDKTFQDTNSPYPLGTVNSGDVLPLFFMHSKYFNIKSGDPDYLKQLSYVPYVSKDGTTLDPATLANFPRKFGFATNDQYLVGSNTCGTYLFLGPDKHKDLSVNSVLFNAGLEIKGGDPDKNTVRIPFYFQARLTDYFGESSPGDGIIGGWNGLTEPKNITFTKKMGVDLLVRDQSLFSFDIKCEIQYKPNSASDINFNNTL